MSILIFVILAVISTVVALLYRSNKKRKEEVLPSYRKRNSISPLPIIDKGYAGNIEGGVTEQELKVWRQQKKERYERRKTEEVVYTPRRTDTVDDPDVTVIPIFPIFVDEIVPDTTPTDLPEEKTEFGGGSFGGAGAEGSWDTKSEPGYSYESDRAKDDGPVYDEPDTDSTDTYTYDQPDPPDCSPSNTDD